MASKHSELVAGTFVILALAAGVGVLIWLGAAEVLTPRGTEVFFATDYKVGNLGLEIGSLVRLNDLPIGKLERMTLDTANARTLYVVRLTRDDVQVRADASASAVAEFIGGASIVLEDLGAEAAGPADAEHPVGLTANSVLLMRMQEVLGYGDQQRVQFQKALASIATAAGKVDIIATAIAAEMDPKTRGTLLVQVKATVDDLRDSSANLLSISKNLKAETEKADAESLLAKVHVSAENVRKVTGEASAMMTTIRPGVEKTVAMAREYTEKDLADLLTKLRKAATELVRIAGEMRAVSGTARDGDIVVLNHAKIDETMTSLKAMALNLEAAAKEIRRNPWRLLARPDETQTASENIYDASRSFAEGAGELDDALIRLLALSKARPEGIRADDPELLKIRKHIEAAFEKFQKVEGELWKRLTGK